MTSYKEYPLNGRTKLAYNWIPDNAGRLLDGGCAYGYATIHFSKKTKTYGIDPNKHFIEIAKKRYKNIDFSVQALEKTNFKDNYFGCIILNDVIEHVEDEVRALNEMYRILEKNGVLIITTPHKGLFGFMDPDNYAYILRKYFYSLYELLFRIKGKKAPLGRPGYVDKHRHYSLKNLENILKKTNFKKKYTIEKVFRSGFLLGPLSNSLLLLGTFLFNRKISEKLCKPLVYFSEKEYWIPFGILSYNIAIRIKKKK